MSKPISPSEVGAYKAKSFPAYVFDAFNHCIAAQSTGGRVTVKQKDVIAKMLELANAGISPGEADEEFGGYGRSLTREQIFDRGYLNVEDAYRDAGWKVEYDKPAYNESYDAFFVFKAK